MKKTTKAAQMPPSITLRLSRGRSVKITWRPRQRVSSLLIKLLTKALAIFLPLSMSSAHALDVNALPTGGQVTAGSATINQTGNTLNINQASQKAALNWQTFNIGTNGTVNFVQPNSNAVALNRIGGNSASEIYGHLNANGQVFLMNPNGILFGRGSQVNVGGIVATTMQLGDADFLAGNYNFSNAGVGSVANYGLINATNSVALLGSDVSNQGSIFATTASLVSGNTVALDVSTDGLIRARVVDAAVQANIANSGDINATQITLSAGQAKDTLNRVVNNSGVIKATGFSSLNGEITLQGGTTLNSGTLDATSATGNGGTVHMLGQHVGVVDSGSIDVSGATGGGTILVGGDYQGKNANIENAEVTYVGAQTTLKADATQNGNGGKVIVWADDTTRAYGSISAQGGALGGDGGFIETSGHRYLDVNGANVNTLALLGLTGNWLLDPRDVTIEHNPGGGTNEGGYTNNPDFLQAVNTAATIYDTTINTALNASNVTITTDNTSNTTTSGDITFDSTNGNILISTSGSGFSRTLILNASRDIAFTGGNDTSFQSSLFSTVPIGLDVRLNATRSIKTDLGSSVTLDGAAPSAGTVAVTVPIAKEWKNDGELNINGNAIVWIESGATFKNDSGAEVNVDGTDTGAAFYGFSGGIINEGTINVNTDAAFGTAYTQQNDELAPSTRGTLNIADGVNLTLWDAISLEGEVHFTGDGTGTLNIDDNNGIANTQLKDLTITGGTLTGGTLNVAFGFDSDFIPSVEFDNVTAPDTTLNIGAHTSYYNDYTDDPGNVTITGDSVFNTVNYIAGTFSMHDANLGITSTNEFIVPPGTYTGNVGYYAAGDLIVNSINMGSGQLNLIAGWDPTSPFNAPTFISTGSLGNLTIATDAVISTANTGSVKLNAPNGAITSDGDINTDSLVANAAKGIELDGNLNNQVTYFSADNTSTGNINFYNNGDLRLETTHNHGAGYINVESGGAIVQWGDITTHGGIITVTASGDLDMDDHDGSIRMASSGGGNIFYESSLGSVNVGLLDARFGSVASSADGIVNVLAGRNITDANDNIINNPTDYKNIIAREVDLTAGDSGTGSGSINLDTQVQTLDVYNHGAVTPGQTISIRNSGSVLSLDVYSDAHTHDITIENDNTINIGHIGSILPGDTIPFNTTITATGASSDIQLGSIGCNYCSTILSEGNVTLTAGRDVLIYDDHVNAGTGMDVTAGRDIIVTANANNASLYTASGNQNITAGRNITLTGGSSSIGAYAEIKHAGSGNQIIDFINGGTLTLIGGTVFSGNRARIENASLASDNSIQKIWRSTSGLAPAIVMNGGSSGGLDSTSSNDLSNSAEIGSEFGQQIIYASTIAMAGMGGATGYAGAIISAPNQKITTTGNVTLTGGSSNGVTAGSGDQFTYNTTTYNLASPAAIGDKNNLDQTLEIGGTLTLNGGSSTSGVAMVGSLHGVATGSIKANAVALNSSGSLAFLGGVEDIIVTNTFANVGGAITDNSLGSHPWSIWALNPTKITGCGAGTGCFADFAQYGVTFGSTPAPTILGTGHGWLYSAAAPALTATTSTNYSRVYDGTANAYLTASNFTVAGANAGDTVALASITGNFANKNVGTAKSISRSAATYSVTAAGIPVYGYATPTISGLSADITQALLNWSVADATGNTGTTPVPGLATLSVIFGSDAVTGVVSAYDANNALAILSAATPEGVYTEKVTGLTGVDAGNYSLASTGTTGVLTVGKSLITPEVEQEVTAVTSETISQPEDTQIKQEEDDVAVPEKVLVALNFVDDPKANKENPVETEKPKGRTLQCSVSK